MPLAIGAALLAGFASFLGITLGLVIRRGRRVARQSRRYVARAQPCTSRALVIGDSSGVGVGASRPQCSVAGLLAGHQPGMTVGNLARIGSRTHDAALLARRLQRRLRANRSYDLLIVHTGGNDILHFTSLRALRHDLRALCRACSRVATRTVVVTGGNLALAPGFGWPLSWLWGHRTRIVREEFKKVTADFVGITYVDLFREQGCDPTEADPPRFFAADGLHPSDANYRLWFDAIVLALGASRCGAIAVSSHPAPRGRHAAARPT